LPLQLHKSQPRRKTSKGEALRRLLLQFDDDAGNVVKRIL
jgi:hypothetical protein